MSNYNKKTLHFKDVKFPDIVFKYRSATNENHLRFIKNREVFFAAPSMFEDVKDCKISTRYDLMTDEEAFSFAMKLSNGVNPHFTLLQHMEDSAKWVHSKIYKKPEFYDSYIKFVNEAYDKRRGILSLTANPCLQRLWEKYADHGKGICIGYNSRIMFQKFGGGGEVIYVDELPLIMPDPIMDDIEGFHKTVFFKERKWDFEEEYRSTKFFTKDATIKDRRIQLPKNAFNCIILGQNIENRDEIIRLVKKYIGNIPIYEQESFCK
ncbi:DUF2971 domain-containing protein [Chryseobacterium lactis]|uniref:DUF2971 domain-containing protein n=1 Tax=Chryseobacterium lactis TaxID=1241981 RepID=UPI001623D7A7|nr:DUF2971 domain-containing protein [Chryseobacterium lactis]